jgi:hypothetical protein
VVSALRLVVVVARVLYVIGKLLIPLADFITNYFFAGFNLFIVI